MKNVNPIYVPLLLLCAFGVWGCSQQKTGAVSARIQELETRYTKLEEDYRALQTTNEQQRKKLVVIEAQRAFWEKDKKELNSQLEAVNNDRETQRKETAQRTQERDAAQANLMQFSKELQALAGRIETAMTNSSPSATVLIIPASRRNE